MSRETNMCSLYAEKDKKKKSKLHNCFEKHSRISIKSNFIINFVEPRVRTKIREYFSAKFY